MLIGITRAVAVLLLATGLVYGIAASAQQRPDAGPPGPGWREIKPPKSLWRRYLDGEDRGRKLPPRPRRQS